MKLGTPKNQLSFELLHQKVDQHPSHTWINSIVIILLYEKLILFVNSLCIL